MGKVKTNFIHLCDAATIDGAGKLNILGIFSVIYLQSVPNSLPKFTNVISFDFEDGIDEKNSLEIKIVGPNKEDIKINPAIKIDFSIPKIKGKKPELNLILDINSLLFESFGEYSLNVLINGENVATKKFTVEERKVN